MPHPTVLFATDFSESSHLALRYAVVQAQDLDARLLIVHVYPVPVASGEGMLHAGVPREDPVLLKQRLQAVLPENFDGHCEHVLLEGDPPRELVRLAQEEKANLIVLGTHGRTGLARFLMGSVAEQVLRRAPCPVLVVKNPALREEA